MEWPVSPPLPWTAHSLTAAREEPSTLMRCVHSASVGQPSRTDGLSGARTPVVMTIQLFYFDGCPSYERALENGQTHTAPVS